MFKKGNPVKFKTRGGLHTGKYQSAYNTLKGQFAIVKCADGAERRVRPSQL